MFALFPMPAFAGNYSLPLQNLKSKDICGSSKCSPGNGGGVFQLVKDPYFIKPQDGETLEKLALRLVGHVRITKDKVGGVPWSCGELELGPDDVEIKVNGVATKYTRTTFSDFNTTVHARKTATALMQTGVIPASSKAKLTAALEGEYKRLSKSDTEVSARYYEIGLTDNRFRAIFQTDVGSSCSKFIKAHPVDLITDIGLILLDATSGRSLVNDIYANLKTSGAIPGGSGEAESTIKNVITTSVSQALGGQVAIVAERRVGAAGFFSSLLAVAEPLRCRSQSAAPKTRADGPARPP